MFDTAASEPTSSDDEMNSFAMLINFCCTIHLQLTFLILVGAKEEEKRNDFNKFICQLHFLNLSNIFGGQMSEFQEILKRKTHLFKK